MKTKMYWFALAACLSVLFPTLLRAQISKDFPDLNACAPNSVNVPQGAGGTMTFKVVWKRLGGKANNTQTGPINLPACDRGRTVAPRGMNGICNACPGQFLVSSVGLSPCTTKADCCVVTDIDSANINCVVAAGTGDQSGFVLQKQASTPFTDARSFTVGAISGSQVNSVSHDTTAGNTITTDLNPDFLITVDRLGKNVDGPMKLIVKKLGVQQPTTREFATTGMSLVQILDRIVTELNAAGISAKRKEGKESAFESHDPVGFLDGYVIVKDIDKQNVESLGIQWAPGALARVESTIKPDKPGTPALTTWGIVLLVSLLLLAGSWILRRSARMQPA